jgi:hypothetical protein
MGVARCEAVSHPSPSSACVVGPILRSVTGPRTTWRAHVGEDNAHWLATECRTARLAGEYRPRDLGGGLRIWLGDDAYELERTDQSGADHHP